MRWKMCDYNNWVKVDARKNVWLIFERLQYKDITKNQQVQCN